MVFKVICLSLISKTLLIILPKLLELNSPPVLLVKKLSVVFTLSHIFMTLFKAGSTKANGRYMYYPMDIAIGKIIKNYRIKLIFNQSNSAV